MGDRFAEPLKEKCDESLLNPGEECAASIHVQRSGRGVEAKVDGKPVAADVEFAFVDGKLWLLQIRPFNESRKGRGADYLAKMDQTLAGRLNQTVNLKEALK